MNTILRAAYKELYTAIDCLDMMNRVEQRHCPSLLSMSMDSVSIAMDLMNRETAVNEGCVPKLDLSFRLESAEEGRSSEHMKEGFGFQSNAPAHTAIPVQHESPILHSTSVTTLDIPSDISPPAIVRALGAMRTLTINESAVAPEQDQEDDACSIDQQSTAGIVTRNPLNYTKTLDGLGRPDSVVLKMARRGGNKEITLPCKYKDGAVQSSYMEASGKFFQGDLKRVAGRVKFLHGYAAKRSILAKCQEEKVSSIDMKSELYVRDPEVGLVPLGDA